MYSENYTTLLKRYNSSTKICIVLFIMGVMLVFGSFCLVAIYSSLLFIIPLVLGIYVITYVFDYVLIRKERNSKYYNRLTDRGFKRSYNYYFIRYGIF